MDEVLQAKIDRLNRAAAIVDKMDLKIPVRTSPRMVSICACCGSAVPVEDVRCRCGGQVVREF